MIVSILHTLKSFTILIKKLDERIEKIYASLESLLLQEVVL